MSGNDEVVGNNGETTSIVSSPFNPIYIKSTDISSIPNETIIDSGASNSKNSHVFQTSVKQFIIKTEKVVDINYSFLESNFDANKKLIITAGGKLELKFLRLLAGTTIFFSINKANVDVEILEWT